MRLPLRPRPKADESLVGYLVRLAAANGRADILGFARSLGMPFSVLTSAATKQFDLATLATAVWLPETALEGMRYRPLDGNLISFMGIPLRRRWITLRKRRACPVCLREADHHRAEWDLAVATVCPRHAVRLINRCLKCGDILLWSAPSITHCACGQDHGDTGNIHRVGARDVRALASVHMLLGLASKPARRCDPLPPQIAALGAEGALSLMFGLGVLANRSDPAPTAPSDLDLNVPLTRGHALVRDWPAAFRGFAGNPYAVGDSDGPGPLLVWAAALGETSALGALIRAELPRPVQRTPQLSGRIRPAPEAAASEALALRLSVARPARPASAYDGCISRPVARKTQASGKAEIRFLDDAAMASRLAVGQRILCALHGAGILRPAGDRSDGEGAGHIWDAREADALIARLEARAAVRGKHRDLLQFPEAFRTLRRAGLAPGITVRSLVRSLAPVRIGRQERGLRRLFYDCGDVLPAAAGEPTRFSTVSIARAAAELGLKPHQAYDLAETGLLRTVVVTGLVALRVDRGELERFREAYVVPGDGRTAGGLTAARLIASGVAPVSGPSVDGALRYAFLRADIQGGKVDGCQMIQNG